MAKEQAQERLRMERLAKFGTLFAGFAHEVRNPLSTIGLNLGLIKEDFVGAETARDKRTYKRISTLETEVRRLQSILDDFLRYVRRPELQLRPTNVNDMLRNLVEFSTAEAREAGIALRFYPGQDVGEIVMDPDLARSAFVNLIRNARQACGEGDQIMISTESDADQGQVVIRFTDTGPGMDDTTRERALEPYFSMKKGGTGLGLPITLRIVEEHGGQMDLSSELGRGTQFTLRLPVQGPEGRS